MADVAVLAEQIQGLTLMEAADLVKVLEEKLGVSAAAPMAMMAAAPAAGPKLFKIPANRRISLSRRPAGPPKRCRGQTP